ncbi:hypothetical protein CUZ56_00956 [Saezia sanguinis]|uniref:Uncharacterized protein n=1 Tax=Saezia sanguinis TaxID=1965230 RepID=A0A433SE49_9BURK|nr:hypothetical protein [Saezia sanguinis]RUS67018.1 hypothetical protein CUZ56_00956 [Saezia sanguinis]
MFNPNELKHTLEIKSKSYNTLMWINSVIYKSRSLSKVRAFAEVAVDTEKWVKQHYALIPEHCKPLPEEIPAFSHLLHSYFHISFVLTGDFKTPYSTLKHALLFVFRGFFYLSLRHVTKADKLEAEKMMIAQLAHTAERLGLETDPEQLQTMLKDKSLHEPVAICAYATDLLQRQKGQINGVPVLALWRKFAWNHHGSPKKNFELIVDMIMNAQHCIQNELLLRLPPLKQPLS